MIGPEERAELRYQEERRRRDPYDDAVGWAFLFLVVAAVLVCIYVVGLLAAAAWGAPS